MNQFVTKKLKKKSQHEVNEKFDLIGHIIVIIGEVSSLFIFLKNMRKIFF